MALRVFTDAAFPASALEILRDGVAPHRLIVAEQPSASVLLPRAEQPALREAEIAFGQPDPDAVLASDTLRWVQLSSASFTRYDTPEFRAAARARGLILTNSSQVYAEACAEHALAFLLAQARQLPRSLATRCGSEDPRWQDLRSSCRPLRGQEALIVGYGAIGACLEEFLRPLGLVVRAFRRSPRGDENVLIVSPEELPAALSRADHVFNILPAAPETTRFFSEAIFRQMKPGAVFYNIGRGATVDQEALLRTLQAEHLDAAWLDVTDPEPLPDGHPLLHESRCFITPHVAGGHRDEAGTLVRAFLTNFERFLRGEPLRDRVF